MDNHNEKELLLQEAKEFESSGWIYFVRKSKLTYLIVIFLLLFGLTTISKLPRELTPEVEIPMAIVATVYPGASPLDMEEQVTKEIETGITDLDGIKNVDSTSSLGVSSIVVEFEAGEDVDDSIRKLKDKVDEVKTDLPEDALEPNVIQINLQNQPILIATLSGANYDAASLKKFADDVKDDLKGISYVSDVRVVGGTDREILIDADPDKLSAKGISLSQLSATLGANNIDFPVGSIDIGNQSYSLRVLGKFDNAWDISQLVVGYQNDKPVFLEDVAQVTEGYKKAETYSRLSINGSEPQPAVSIQVFKKTGGDITALVQEAKSRLQEAKGDLYPEDVQMEVTYDTAEYILQNLNELSKSGIETVLIILIVLMFFMGWKEALLTGLSVPFSFFMAFIIMSVLGESLNFLSLFALILALGLVVDSAVVIVEGINNKVVNYGIDGYRAAILSIKEYSAPLLSGILTSVAAFFPLMFIQGIMGQFMRVIPVVVVATVLSSLFVAITIIPSIGSTFLTRKPEKKPKRIFLPLINFFARLEKIGSGIIHFLSEKYYNFIPKLLTNAGARKKIIIGVWFLFLVSACLPFTGLVKMQSFQKSDADTFNINVKLPNGTGLEKTNEVVKQIEAIVRQEPLVVNFVSSVGTGSSFGASSSEGNEAFLQVNLLKKDLREPVSGEIVAELREKINAQITNAEVTMSEESSGPPSGDNPIVVRVMGEDLNTLEKLANQIKDELAQIPTTVEIKTSVEYSFGELVFVPDKNMLAENGLTLANVASEMRQGISRNDELTISNKGEEINIDIGYSEDKISSVSSLAGLEVKNSSGEKVALSQLGKITLAPSLASVTHRDKERVITVSSNTDGGNVNDITNDLKQRVSQLEMPAGYKVVYGGEQQEMNEIFSDMFLKMILGVILMLFILVIEFNSFRQVTITLFTIPLALIGVIWGMMLSRLTLDIPAFIGIVSLGGIEVNNAVILIDQINRGLSRGKSLIEAAREAGAVRLRPILLTKSIAIIGLLPLSITQPDWRTLGFSIIYGLTFGTLLSLFVVPIMYVSFYRKKYAAEAGSREQ